VPAPNAPPECRGGGRQTCRGAPLLAELLMVRKDYEAANTQYLEILKVSPDNLVSLNNLAFNLAEHLGRPQEALP
jgi:hypothetical protein